jgi:hypothetical protein
MKNKNKKIFFGVYFTYNKKYKCWELDYIPHPKVKKYEK